MISLKSKAILNQNHPITISSKVSAVFPRAVVNRKDSLSLLATLETSLWVRGDRFMKDFGLKPMISLKYKALLNQITRLRLVLRCFTRPVEPKGPTFLAY